MLPSLVWGHGLIVCDWQLKVSSKGFKINCQCQSQGETLEDRQSLSLTDWHTNWLNDWLLTRNVLLSCPDSDHVLSFLSTHLCFTHICGRRTPSCWLLVGTYTRALGLCIRTHSLGPWDYTSELIYQDSETLYQNSYTRTLRLHIRTHTPGPWNFAPDLYQLTLPHLRYTAIRGRPNLLVFPNYDAICDFDSLLYILLLCWTLQSEEHHEPKWKVQQRWKDARWHYPITQRESRT